MAVANKTKKVFDGKFEILSIVGRGSKSVVYHAKHITAPHQEVALKVLLNSEDDTVPQTEKMRKEALAMVSSNHRYVIKLNDFHSVDNLSYISMELAPLGDLRKFADKSGGQLSLELIESFLLQAAEALHNVHKNGIIHRDIKPENILVASEREIRLGDFGLALLPGETATKHEIESGVGTFDYMAPEILEGQSYTQASDIYSLGVTFYEMVAGRNPFAGRSLAQQLDLRRDDRIPALRTLSPDAPEYLTSAITQAISFDSTKRFSSAKELLQTILVNKQRARSAPKNIPIAAISDPLPAAEPQTTELASDTSNQAHTPARPPSTSEEISQEAILSGTVALDSAEREQLLKQAEISESTSAANSDEIAADETVVFTKKQLSDILKRSESSLVPRTSTLPDIRDRLRNARASTVFLARDRLKNLFGPFNILRSVDIESKRSLVMVLGITVVVLGLIVSQGTMNRVVRSAENAPQDTAIQAKEPELLSASSADNQQFPFMDGGVYSGTITGIRAESSAPLLVVSLPTEKQLIFLAGVPGWSAAKVDISRATDNPAPTLRIVSNGNVYLLTGQNVEGSYMGFLTDAISGRKGEWQVTKLKVDK